MTPKYLFEVFRSIVYFNDLEIEAWFPNNNDSIRLRTKHGAEELIFSVPRDKEWCLETKQHYISRMKGR